MEEKYLSIFYSYISIIIDVVLVIQGARASEACMGLIRMEYFWFQHQKGIKLEIHECDYKKMRDLFVQVL